MRSLINRPLTVLEGKESSTLKLNIIGIVGVILLFVSLALPWWTMSLSSAVMNTNVSEDISVYPYQATVSTSGAPEAIDIGIWYGWVALALVLISGMIGIIASVKTGKAKLLAISGMLALLSIIIFAVGLQCELANLASVKDFPSIGLFDSGSYDHEGLSVIYSASLSFGFWLALAAVIVIFLASMKKPAPVVTVPLPASPQVAY